jgi:hypothetical protein
MMSSERGMYFEAARRSANEKFSKKPWSELTFFRKDLPGAQTEIANSSLARVVRTAGLPLIFALPATPRMMVALNVHN